MVPMGFTGPYIGLFVLLIIIGVGIGGLVWFLGRQDTYGGKENRRW